MEQRNDAKTALISEEAANWFVRLQDERVGGRERRRGLRWLKASPMHVAEALRVAQIYQMLRTMKVETDGTIEDLRSNVVEFVAPDGVRRERDPESAGARVPWKPWGLIAAMLVVSLAVVLGSLQFGWISRTYAAGPGEWRRIALSDGTVMRVGPRSEVSVKLTLGRRSIQLRRGEALFDVATDPSRPFYVSAGAALVRAVGTEFGVSRLGDKVVVTVAEGAVAVSQQVSEMQMQWHAEPSVEPGRVQPTVAVAAGEQVAVSPSVWPSNARRVNVERELAWAQGRLIFEDMTIAQAIDEFNRRNRLQIDVRDPAIAGRPVRGIFDAADPESFALFLARAARVTIVRERPNVLLLVPLQQTGRHYEREGMGPISRASRSATSPQAALG
jgi:transmembrane sensor